MHRFHELPDAAVILHAKGVYRQAKVFRRGDAIFAAHGTGFIRLYAQGGTSIPSVRWEDIDVNHKTVNDAFGRLSLSK